jgi:hypothetical protein
MILGFAGLFVHKYFVIGELKAGHVFQIAGLAAIYFITQPKA